MKRIAINGTFFSEKRTGIYRFAEEIIKALDNQVADLDVRLIVPKNISIPLVLNNIKVIEFGYGKGISWEQTFFALYLWLHCATALNLCNVTPLLAPRGFSVIHDISYKVNPQYFSHFYGKFSRLWHCLNYWVIVHFSRHIFSVSDFSKNEISKVYGVSPQKITVTYNSWQHMLNIKPSDESIVKQYGLTSHDYFLSLSTIAPNKNFKWILEVAKKNPLETFAIAGSLNPIRFGLDLTLSNVSNVKFLGYVCDEDYARLVRECKAFIFPSFYEGFGLPPLEALAMGAKIIVSKRASLPEVCEDAAYYIDPNDYEVDLNRLIMKNDKAISKILKKYDWNKSANIITLCIQRH